MLNLKQICPKEKLKPIQLEQKLGDAGDGIYDMYDIDYFADLRTNEHFNPTFAKSVHRAVKPRYVVGIGFGNILSYVATCDPSELQGVFCVDLSYHVGNIGRATRHILQIAGKPDEFIEITADRQRLQRELSDVVGENYVADVTHLLRERVHWKGDRTKKRRSEGELSDILSGRYNPFEEDVVDVAAVLLQNYRLFRRLATEGRIGILVRNIKEFSVLQSLGELEGYNSGNSILYLSSLLPYLAPQLKMIVESSKPINGQNLIASFVGNPYRQCYSVCFSIDDTPVLHTIQENKKDGLEKFISLTVE